MKKNMRLLLSTVVSIFTLFLFSTAHAQLHEDLQKQIVVVGGGLAGLAALDELQSMGYTNVILLESADRLGGKVQTQFHADGTFQENGAELVNASDADLIRLLKKYQINLVERKFAHDDGEKIFQFRERRWSNGQLTLGPPKDYTFKELVDTMLKNPADVEALSKIAKFQSNPTAETRKFLEETTAADFLKGSELVLALTQAFMESELGAALEDMNAATILQNIRVEDGRYILNPHADETYRIEGGSDRLIRKLGAKYQKNIRLNAAVSAIQKQSENSPYVVTAIIDGTETQVQADAVIMAAPTYALPKMKINVPGVSQTDIDEATKMPFANNAKILLRVDKRFWQGRTRFQGELILESGIEMWETSENQATDHALLTIYTRAWPQDAQKAQSKLESLLLKIEGSKGFEGLRSHILETQVFSYDRSYSCIYNKNFPQSRVPELFKKTIAGLIKGLAFIGSDKDYDFENGELVPAATHGYMTGAVHSALMSVTSVLESLRLPVRCEGLY